MVIGTTASQHHGPANATQARVSAHRDAGALPADMIGESAPLASALAPGRDGAGRGLGDGPDSIMWQGGNVPTFLSQQDDQSLAMYFLSGDPSALEELYKRHFQTLQRFMGRMLAGFAHHVEDAIGDVWCAVLSPDQDWSASVETPFALRLLAQGLRVAQDIEAQCPTRRAEAERLANQNDLSFIRPQGMRAWLRQPLPQRKMSLDEISLWQSLGDEVIQHAARMPIAQRAALYLHHDVGLPLSDIAAVLGVDAERVKTLVRYAMVWVQSATGEALAQLEVTMETAHARV